MKRTKDELWDSHPSKEKRERAIENWFSSHAEKGLVKSVPEMIKFVLLLKPLQCISLFLETNDLKYGLITVTNHFIT